MADENLAKCERSSKLTIGEDELGILEGLLDQLKTLNQSGLGRRSGMFVPISCQETPVEAKNVCSARSEDELARVGIHEIQIKLPDELDMRVDSSDQERTLFWD